MGFLSQKEDTKPASGGLRRSNESPLGGKCQPALPSLVCAPGKAQRQKMGAAWRRKVEGIMIWRLWSF